MRDALADQWNVVAVYGGLGYGAEGLPAANSHYGYHLLIPETIDNETKGQKKK